LIRPVRIFPEELLDSFADFIYIFPWRLGAAIIFKQGLYTQKDFGAKEFKDSVTVEPTYFPSIFLITVSKFNKLNGSDSSFFDIIWIETNDRSILKIDGLGNSSLWILVSLDG